MFRKRRPERAGTTARKQGRNAEAPGSIDNEPSGSVDGFLKLSGLALAVVCALLPWAAYMQNSASTGTPAADAGKVRDPLDRSNQRSRFGTRDRLIPAQEVARLGLDPTPTGTTSLVGGAAAGGAGEEDPKDQPFPARPEFLLRDVVGGMGMVEDQTGFWFVERGSLLPDSSHVVEIAKLNGLWQITTSDGRIIRQTP